MLPQLDDLQGLNIMFAEKLGEWALDYKAQGIKQGMQKGECLLCKNY